MASEPAIQIPGKSQIQIGNTQAEHRINILDAWHGVLKPGSRVLEIGCGQGTCTEVLAEAVGESGHIDAVDPGSPDYGSPWTLAEAQAHLSAGPLGPRITWLRADPVGLLSRTATTGQTWDVAVLAHCIWYFKSFTALARILAALRGRVGRVCIAEYALHATHPAAVPHVLAALARGTLEAHRDRERSDENIQTPLSPAAVREIAGAAGWAVESQGTVVPEHGLDDGRWETGTVIGMGYLADAHREVGNDVVLALLKSAQDAVVAAVEGIGGIKAVRTMDVWVATLVEEHKT
jgi:SAM-dependent methyltransferase